MSTPAIGSGVTAQSIFQSRQHEQQQQQQQQTVGFNTQDTVVSGRPLDAGTIYRGNPALQTKAPQKELGFWGAVGAVVVGCVIYASCCSGKSSS